MIIDSIYPLLEYCDLILTPVRRPCSRYVFPTTCLFGDLRREQAVLRIRSYSLWIFGIDTISSPRLLSRRKPILGRNRELPMILIITSMDRYDVNSRMEPRASNGIDYYLYLDKTRRRYYNIFTIITPLEADYYSKELRAFNSTGFYFYKQL